MQVTITPATNATSSAKRPYFKLKSQWAIWEAERVRVAIAQLREERIPSANWRAIRRKSAAIDRLEETRRDWERRADSYRLQEAGVTPPARRYGGARQYAPSYR